MHRKHVTNDVFFGFSVKFILCPEQFACHERVTAANTNTRLSHILVCYNSIVFHLCTEYQD